MTRVIFSIIDSDLRNPGASEIRHDAMDCDPTECDLALPEPWVIFFFPTYYPAPFVELEFVFEFDLL